MYSLHHFLHKIQMEFWLYSRDEYENIKQVVLIDQLCYYCIFFFQMAGHRGHIEGYLMVCISRYLSCHIFFLLRSLWRKFFISFILIGSLYLMSSLKPSSHFAGDFRHREPIRTHKYCFDSFCFTEYKCLMFCFAFCR